MRLAISEGGSLRKDSRRPVKSRARTAACSSLCSCDMDETLPGVGLGRAPMIALNAPPGGRLTQAAEAPRDRRRGVVACAPLVAESGAGEKARAAVFRGSPRGGAA